ncbi:cytochrome-c peroxidase [Methylomonas sp. MgM2]
MKTLIGTTLLLGSMTGYAGQAALTSEQELGKTLFTDQNLSLNRNQSCSSCHSLEPARAKPFVTRRVPGFVDPDNVKHGTAVSKGSVDGLSGSLNAPSVGYAGFSPDFHFDENEGLYVGGQFWNGRAKTLIEQAQGPFLNPVEMALPDIAEFIDRLKENRKYKRLFEQAYRIDLDRIDMSSPEDQAQVFEAAATAISLFEQSPVFNKFNSKFDYVISGKTKFTPLEAKGFDVFNGKGNCAACHIGEATLDDDGHVVEPALFTDFTYDNIGLPRNVNIPGNPKPDEGLGGQLGIDEEKGKHKVMSLRNIALTAPYGHNGSMATLEQIVHFYNTRDTLGYVADINQPGFGKTGWPEPEFYEEAREVDTVNRDELGDLGLSPFEEKALVAFLKTLTDDYPEWGHDRRVPTGTPSPYAKSELEHQHGRHGYRRHR